MQNLNLASFAVSLLPALFAAGAGGLGFMYWDYRWECRQRRQLQTYWRSRAAKPHADELFSALEPALLRWNLFSGLRSGSAETAVENLPAFSSFLKRHLRSYCLALVFVGMALGVRLVLEPALQGRVPYGFFLLAVLLAAWVTGVWQTLMALTLGFLAAEWYVVAPRGSFMIHGLDAWLGALLYLFAGLGVVWFMRSEQAGWLQALSSDIAALKRLEELQKEKASHEQTRAVREILANIVESARDPILSLTREGRISTWNGAAERLFGFSAPEAIGQPLSLIVPPERRTEFERLLAQIARGERTETLQIVLHGKTGLPVDCVLTISPVNDEAGKLAGTSIIARDRPAPPLATVPAPLAVL